MVRWLALLSLLTPGVARAAPPSLSPSPAVAFVDVSVVPMDSERVLEHQTVVIRGVGSPPLARSPRLRCRPRRCASTAAVSG